MNGRDVPVLAVDDQPVFLDAAHDVVLATPGFDWVGGAGSGEEAIDAIEQLHPALVLLDVRMPGMDGFETAQRIRERHPEVVVVLISDRGQPGLRAHRRGLGRGHAGEKAGPEAQCPARAVGGLGQPVGRPAAVTVSARGPARPHAFRSPGCDRTSSFPPTASRRSRMFTRPRPGGPPSRWRSRDRRLRPRSEGRRCGAARSGPRSPRARAWPRSAALRRSRSRPPSPRPRGSGRCRRRRPWRQRATGGPRPDRGRQPAVLEHRGIDAGGERTQLLEGCVHVVAQAMEHLPGAGVAGGQHLVRQLEPDPKGHQPLLAAVVEVPLDAAALVVGGHQDARPGSPQLRQRLLDLRREPAVVVPDEGVGAHRLDEGALVAERGVVDHRGHGPLVVGDHGGVAISGGGGSGVGRSSASRQPPPSPARQ